MPLWYVLFMEQALPVATTTVPTWIFSTGLAASFVYGLRGVIRQLKQPDSFLAIRVAVGYLTSIVYGLATVLILGIHSGCEPEYVVLHPVWAQDITRTAKADECGDETATSDALGALVSSRSKYFNPDTAPSIPSLTGRSSGHQYLLASIGTLRAAHSGAAYLGR